MKKFSLLFLAVVMAVVGLKAQTLPPAEATVENWHISAQFTSGSESEDVVEDMQVAITGSDVYFKFPNPITGATWMKGTLNGETATFAKGQVVGTYGGSTIYYMGLNADGLCDMVFTYSEANEMFYMADMWLALTNSLTEPTALGYFSSIVVSKSSGGTPSTLPEVVTPPTDLATSPYIFTGRLLHFDDEGSVAGFEEVQRNIRVGFYNNQKEVYMQGLCSYLPDAWVKGTVADGSFGDKEVTLPAGQFYGQYGVYPLYLIARMGNYLTDMLFDYDPQTRQFTNGVSVYLVLSVMPDQPAPIEQYATVTLTPGSLSGIQTQQTGQTDKGGWYTLQGQRVDAPGKGLYIHNGRKIIRK